MAQVRVRGWVMNYAFASSHKFAYSLDSLSTKCVHKRCRSLSQTACFNHCHSMNVLKAHPDAP